MEAIREYGKSKLSLGGVDLHRTAAGNVEITHRLTGQRVTIDHADVPDIIRVLEHWHQHGNGRAESRAGGPADEGDDPGAPEE